LEMPEHFPFKPPFLSPLYPPLLVPPTVLEWMRCFRSGTHPSFLWSCYVLICTCFFQAYYGDPAPRTRSLFLHFMSASLELGKICQGTMKNITLYQVTLTYQCSSSQSPRFLAPSPQLARELTEFLREFLSIRLSVWGRVVQAAVFVG